MPLPYRSSFLPVGRRSDGAICDMPASTELVSPSGDPPTSAKKLRKRTHLQPLLRPVDPAPPGVPTPTPPEGPANPLPVVHPLRRHEAAGLHEQPAVGASGNIVGAHAAQPKQAVGLKPSPTSKKPSRGRARRCAPDRTRTCGVSQVDFDMHPTRAAHDPEDRRLRPDASQCAGSSMLQSLLRHTGTRR